MNWHAEQWSAFGTVGTLVVAAIAAGFAYVQVRDARSLRREQAKPNVIVSIVLSPASTMHFDLVVKNIGHTVARDVRVHFEPALTSTLDSGRGRRADAKFLAEGIPTLPPGMEYRLLFDNAVQRLDSDLPRSHRATVTYRGLSGEPSSDQYVLDMSTWEQSDWLTIYGLHDLAKAARDIAQLLKKVENRSGLRVWAVDEHAHQERERTAREARRAEREETASEQ